MRTVRLIPFKRIEVKSAERIILIKHSEYKYLQIDFEGMHPIPLGSYPYTPVGVNAIQCMYDDFTIKHNIFYIFNIWGRTRYVSFK